MLSDLRHRRVWWRGVLTGPAVFGALGVATMEYWPDTPLLGPLARMVESAVPHLAILTLVFAAALAWLGAARFGIVLAIVTLVGMGSVGLRHAARAAPLQPEAPQALRVLWYNMLNTNPVPPQTLALTLEKTPADVIILAEAAPVAALRPLLQTRFATVEGCARRSCDLMILARDPALRVGLVRMPSTGTHRMGIVELDLPGAAPLRVVAVHMVKPWYYGLSESDQWMVVRQSRTAPGPLVVVGDFNAAPWSQRMRWIARPCDLRTQPWPVATWPASLGAFGIPIDLILTRGGAVVKRVDPWGGVSLGSNHRGLLFEIGLQPDAKTATPDGCAVVAPPADSPSDTAAP